MKNGIFKSKSRNNDGHNTFAGIPQMRDPEWTDRRGLFIDTKINSVYNLYNLFEHKKFVKF